MINWGHFTAEARRGRGQSQPQISQIRADFLRSRVVVPTKLMAVLGSNSKDVCLCEICG